MSLRVRLIVAFFLLSVVPLAALTVYAYANNARAVREAAGREAELLAGELTQRMQVVTARLSERVEYLVDLAETNEAAEMAVKQALQETAIEQQNQEQAADDAVADTLGQLAMILNNVELRDPARGRGAGGRGGGRRGDAPRGGGPPAGPAAPGASGSAVAEGGRGRGPGVTAGGPPPPPGPPGAPGLPGSPPAAEASDRISIDMMPIRRDILQQYASQDEWQKLSESERQRIIGEVNQRMLGIAMGIRMGTAEAQRRVAEAEKAASAKAREAVASTRTRPAGARARVSASPMQRKATLSGSRLDVRLERDGELVRQVNAEVDLQSLLGTVFSTTRRDRGEVPFAISRDGHIYVPSEDDRGKVEALGADVTSPTAPPGTLVLPAWVAVTTADPTGAGLKFGIARPLGESLSELQQASARNAAIGLGFIGLALIGIVPIAGRLTRHLSSLADAVHRLAQGDYHARAPVRSNDEVGRLAVAFNQMAEDVERHQRAAVGQERIRRELELGRQIQYEMLPHASLHLGLTEVKGVSVPAREVGGDFFNYFQIPSGPIALLMGDVSGKGVGAALLMANIQASIRTRIALGQDLAAIASELDVDLEANTPRAFYATLFLAMLDVDTHRLRYVNAGHHPQYLLRTGGGFERMSSTGLPVGLLSGHGYGEGSVEVAPGDVLFFYTDGCVETESESDEMFGSERLETLLRSLPLSGPDDLLAAVELEISRFRGTREPFDDATMMAVRVG